MTALRGGGWFSSVRYPCNTLPGTPAATPPNLFKGASALQGNFDVAFRPNRSIPDLGFALTISFGGGVCQGESEIKDWSIRSNRGGW